MKKQKRSKAQSSRGEVVVRLNAAEVERGVVVVPAPLFATAPFTLAEGVAGLANEPDAARAISNALGVPLELAQLLENAQRRGAVIRAASEG